MALKMKDGILESIIEDASCGILVTDDRGNIVITNKEHQQMTQRTKAELAGMNMQELVDERILDTSSSLKVLKTKKPLILEQKINLPGETVKFIMVKTIPYFDSSGRLENVVSYLSDISEKNRLLRELAENSLKNEKYDIELQQLRKAVNRNSKIIARSPQMRNLIGKAEKVAATDSTVLLTGESGVGKGLFAKYIHANSNRAESPFLTVNCGAIPENLIESELFGYEKGSFSGASSEGKKGLFEYADKGTLFLDEIGDMPYGLQVKLLQVLQDGQFYRVGGVQPVKVDVRIIAATNLNLQEEIAKKRFRQDLFYRLNVLSLNILPLRERREDLPLMVETFRRRNNQQYQMNKRFSPASIERLMNLELPGNVRELENIVERSILFSLNDVIEPNELCDETPPGICGNSNGKGSIKAILQDEEKRILEEAVAAFKTATAVAEYFNVSQPTISRKLKKYGIRLK